LSCWKVRGLSDRRSCNSNKIWKGEDDKGKRSRRNIGSFQIDAWDVESLGGGKKFPLGEEKSNKAFGVVNLHT